MQVTQLDRAGDVEPAGAAVEKVVGKLEAASGTDSARRPGAIAFPWHRSPTPDRQPARAAENRVATASNPPTSALFVETGITRALRNGCRAAAPESAAASPFYRSKSTTADQSLARPGDWRFTRRAIQSRRYPTTTTESRKPLVDGTIQASAAARGQERVRVDESLWTVRQQDCVEGLKQLPAGCVDLAFADPPFNIGYEYDVYDDRQKREVYLDWCRSWIEPVHRALKPSGTFWLAIGDEFAAELKLPSQEIGFHCRSWVDLVLHVRRQLHAQVQPLARPFVLLRQGSEKFHLSAGRPGKSRPLGPAARLCRRAGQSAGPLAGRHVDPASAGLERLLHRGGGHLVFPARGGDLQGAGRLSRLPDARATSGPHHPHVLRRRRTRRRPVCRQRDHAGRRQKTRPPLARFRAQRRLRPPGTRPARASPRGRLARGSGEPARQCSVDVQRKTPRGVPQNLRAGCACRRCGACGRFEEAGTACPTV